MLTSCYHLILYPRMKDRVQLGARVRPVVAEALKASAESTGLPIQVIVEDALLLFWGSDDSVLKSRHQLAVEAWKHYKGKVKRPFEVLLAP